MAEVTLKEIYPVPESFRQKAYIKSREEYEKMWKESLDDNDGFWAKIAEEYITWYKKWDKVSDCNYGSSAKDLWVKWFVNAKVNVSYNCLDRHLEKRGDQVAIIWEGNDTNEDAKFTYKQVHEQVCKFANVLKKNGVKKGDRVTFYLPMIPELAFGILACTRIGAVHSVVFGGFSAEALRDSMDASLLSASIDAPETARAMGRAQAGRGIDSDGKSPDASPSRPRSARSPCPPFCIPRTCTRATTAWNAPSMAPT